MRPRILLRETAAIGRAKPQAERNPAFHLK